VNIQLNIVTCPSHPEKFIRDSVVAPFLQLSVVIVTAACNITSATAQDTLTHISGRSKLMKHSARLFDLFVVVRFAEN